MTWLVLDLIADAMYKVFGGGLFLPILLIGVLAMIILTIRGGKVLFFMIITPLVTVMITYGVTSRFFQGMTINTQWVPVVAWLALGVIMASVFWAIIR